MYTVYGVEEAKLLLGVDARRECVGIFWGRYACERFCSTGFQCETFSLLHHNLASTPLLLSVSKVICKTTKASCLSAL